jgi:hypothetical protein
LLRRLTWNLKQRNSRRAFRWISSGFPNHNRSGRLESKSEKSNGGRANLINGVADLGAQDEHQGRRVQPEEKEH